MPIDEQNGDDQQTPIPNGEWADFIFRAGAAGTPEFARVIAVSNAQPLWQNTHPPHGDGHESWYTSGQTVTNSFRYERVAGALKADGAPQVGSPWTHKGEDTVDGTQGWSTIPNAEVVEIWRVQTKSQNGNEVPSPLKDQFGVALTGLGTGTANWYRKAGKTWSTPFMTGSDANPSQFTPKTGDFVTFVKATITIGANETWERRSTSLF